MSRRRACRSRHRGGVRRELVGRLLGVLREVVELHRGRDQRGAVGDHSVDEVLGEAGAVLDAVDAGVDEDRQHLGAEAVRGDPGAERVGGFDRGGERVGRERRRQVAAVALDPVADQLDPAIAASGLLLDVRREVVRLDLPGVVADVAAGAGDVPTHPDQPGQVVAVLDPAGVGGAAAVAQQQRPGVAVGHGLGLGLVAADLAVLVEPDVAVRVDQAGHDPTARDRLGTRLWLVGDPAVHDVEVAGLTVGEDRSGDVQGSHASGPYRYCPPARSSPIRCGARTRSGRAGRSRRPRR